MVFEDATIALVGVLASEHYIPLFLGIVMLIIGIVIGDSVAFVIGKFATRNNLARRIIEHERVMPLRSLLHKRTEFTIFIIRFMPGFRFSFYLACGFFGILYKRFLPLSFMSATVWATTLSTLSFLFGIYTLHLFGYWRWPILAGILLLLFFTGRYGWRKMTAAAKLDSEQDNIDENKNSMD